VCWGLVAFVRFVRCCFVLLAVSVFVLWAFLVRAALGFLSM